MENVEFKLDTKEIEAYSKKLGTLHRSAYPSAVRATLNGAAFDVKQRSLLVSAQQNFVERQANFFKANSKVKPASGWDVQGMKSIVGMVPLKGTNKAVDDLEQQEHGGIIKGRSFVPLDSARKGGNYENLVENKNRISKVKKVFRAGRQRKPTRGQRFVSAAFKAGVGGLVIGENSIAYRVDRLRKRGNKKLDITPVYKFKKRGAVKIKKATHFMENAAKESAKKMPQIFKKEAEFQFKKHLG